MVRNPGTFNAMVLVSYAMSFIGKGTICGLIGWIAYLIE
jgi:hypothetical protein